MVAIAAQIEAAPRLPRAVGSVVLLAALAGLAKLGHLSLPQVPSAVWALGVGIVAAALLATKGRAPRALPHELPLALGMILMGAQMDLGLFASVGLRGLLLVAAVWVTVVLLFALAWRARLVSARLAGLLALGLSGCGVTAITAAAQQDPQASGAPEVFASVVVLATGALALVVLPLVAGALGLSAGHFGAWAGVSIANSAEALAAGERISGESMRLAAGYKLLVNGMQGLPILAYLWFFSAKAAPEAQAGSRSLRAIRGVFGRVPFFVWGFAVVAALSTAGLFNESERENLANIARWAFFLALVAIGFRTRVSTLREVGARPLLAGVAVWGALSALTLLLIREF